MFFKQLSFKQPSADSRSDTVKGESSHTPPLVAFGQVVNLGKPLRYREVGVIDKSDGNKGEVCVPWS